MKFFREGNTTEDILKSENEIEEIAAKIYEKKSSNENTALALHKAKAKQALDFIAHLKGFEHVYLL